MLRRCEIVASACRARAHNPPAFIRSINVDQGQGDSTSSILNATKFSRVGKDDRDRTGAETPAKPKRDFGAEWPGPLDGPLGYSET